MTPTPASPDRQAHQAMPTIADCGDFAAFRLDPNELSGLVENSGECVLAWTTETGSPMAVVMAYVFRHDRFWTNCAVHRKRVKALKARPPRRGPRE